MPDSLPHDAKSLWEKVYNSALSGSCKGDKECAAKSAWGALKSAGWKKQGDSWVKSSGAIAEFSMYFSKVGTNTKKWSMTASDTLLDLRDEAMSLELYKSFTENIEKDLPVPDPFAPIVTDSFWEGGMPYLSIAHFPALDGEGIPGDVHAVYVDGNQLKAKGVFNETPLGLATWKSILADKSGTSHYEDKTRVSIGFLDLSHKHGDFVFERKSLDDRCPMCEEGAGNKVYLKGYLVHLAMTRVPVNPRSEVEVDLSMTTRKEDAESIVGEELAETLAEKQKALIGKSDILVERADGDEPETPADTVSSDEPKVEEKQDEKVEEAPEPEPEKVDASLVSKDEYSLKDVMNAINELRSRPEKSVVERSFDALMEVMRSTMVEQITPDEKLQKIQPALNELATSIQEEVSKSTPAPEPAAINENDIQGLLSKAIQPVLEKMSLLETQVQQMASVPSEQRRVPQPRSINPIAVKSLTATKQRELTPMEKIARQSVGLNTD